MGWGRGEPGLTGENGVLGRILRGKRGFWAGPKVGRGGHDALPPVTIAATGKISRDLPAWAIGGAPGLARVARGRR